MGEVDAGDASAHGFRCSIAPAVSIAAELRCSSASSLANKRSTPGDSAMPVEIDCLGGADVGLVLKNSPRMALGGANELMPNEADV